MIPIRWSIINSIKPPFFQSAFSQPTIMLVFLFILIHLLVCLRMFLLSEQSNGLSLQGIAWKKILLGPLFWKGVCLSKVNEVIELEVPPVIPFAFLHQDLLRFPGLVDLNETFVGLERGVLLLEESHPAKHSVFGVVYLEFSIQCEEGLSERRVDQIGGNGDSVLGAIFKENLHLPMIFIDDQGKQLVFVGYYLVDAIHNELIILRSQLESNLEWLQSDYLQVGLCLPIRFSLVSLPQHPPNRSSSLRVQKASQNEGKYSGNDHFVSL